MIFYLGTPEPSWLRRTDVPLFVSARRLRKLKRAPKALGAVALDSGGFTEIERFGAWKTSPEQYRDEVERWNEEVGGFQWVAPQDYMSEPFMIAKTGLTIAEHQKRTIESVLWLRARLDVQVIPVLQGWQLEDYLNHAKDYAAAGIQLHTEKVVGLGSVCRRQGTKEAASIVGTLVSECGIRTLHGFGMKLGGLRRIGTLLGSADSMALELSS